MVAAQTDAALLQAENIDWQRQTLQYRRRKTGEWACCRSGPNWRPSETASVPRPLVSNDLRNPRFRPRGGVPQALSPPQSQRDQSPQLPLFLGRKGQGDQVPERWAQNAWDITRGRCMPRTPVALLLSVRP